TGCGRRMMHGSVTIRGRSPRRLPGNAAPARKGGPPASSSISLLPGAREPSEQDELAEVTGIAAGDQQRLTQTQWTRLQLMEGGQRMSSHAPVPDRTRCPSGLLERFLLAVRPRREGPGQGEGQLVVGVIHYLVAGSNIT